MNDRPLMTIENMSKSFGITKALKKVHFELRYGEIHGLIGENGSGKSTLSSIVAAIQDADEGVITYKDAPYNPKTAVEANELGVCMILQEKGTFDGLSVATNIFAGKENRFMKNGLLDVSKMNKEGQKALNNIHAEHIRAESYTGMLTFEDRKLVELARAMYFDPEVLIIDETTTALSRNGRQILFQVMDEMKAKGRSVIFISHDLDELMEVCDRLTVLRDGDYIATVEKPQYNASIIRKYMVGRDVADNYYRSDNECTYDGEVVLRAEGIYSPELRDISFELHKGEILGIGGLADSGMHTLGSVLFGLKDPDFGIVTMKNGEKVSNPRTATGNKIAYLSKNRDTESLIISACILDNICMPSYKKIEKGPFVWKRNELKFAKVWSEKLEIKMRDLNQFIVDLSGGNKQKVAIAKWLGFGADIFIMDCPTRGIDIGVKANIYQLMEELKAQGKSIILIAEEMQELIGMSDRILVLKSGSINAEFRRDEGVTEQKIIEYMI